jgi:hypothetical protein
MTSRFVCVLGACAALGAGCYREAEIPVGHVEITSAPYGIASVFFEGRPVHWYGGRWYFMERGHWHYYRVEPHALHEHRRRSFGYD